MKISNHGCLDESTITLSGREAMEIVQLVYRFTPKGVFMAGDCSINGYACNLVEDIDKFVRDNYSEEDMELLYPDGDYCVTLPPYDELAQK